MSPHKIVLILFAFMIGLSGMSPSRANDETIRFGISDVGYPPYLMSADGERHGIMGDTFEAVASILGYDTEFVSLPPMRIRRGIENGELDVWATAPEWEEDASRYKWTDPIIQVSDNVVMLDESRADIADPLELSGKSVAIRGEYKYPSLEAMISNNEILAVSVSHFDALLNMVARDRVEFGVVDANVAKWIIRQQNLEFAKPLHFSNTGFDEVGFRILLYSDKWSTFVADFNSTLAAFKKTDEWQAVLDRYK